ncbi:hypothetical protein Tco_1044567 [Tanacetum coccineum]|uniref:Uncharacterized protein n=1 Tax=Tanacetum coccineum TaxID=301880 RepID=A0ABQ5GSH0_9ASTR
MGRPDKKEVSVLPYHTKKVFANMKRPGKDFSGRVTPLFSTMMIKDSEDIEEVKRKQRKKVNSTSLSLMRPVSTPSYDLPQSVRQRQKLGRVLRKHIKEERSNCSSDDEMLEILKLSSSRNSLDDGQGEKHGKNSPDDEYEMSVMEKFEIMFQNLTIKIVDVWEKSTRSSLIRLRPDAVTKSLTLSLDGSRQHRFMPATPSPRATPSGYGVLIMNPLGSFVKCRHKYAVSSLMDMAYRMSESVSLNVFV